MSTITTPKATLADLANVGEKAELIDGRIIPLMPTGYRPSRVAFRIARSLDDFVRATGKCHAFGDNVGFAVGKLTSGRESFSPDAAIFFGTPPSDEMEFVDGPPAFTVEVRSKSDYMPIAESAMADKRSDYFEAGTQVVWEVDPVENVIDSYQSSAPEHPKAFRSGQTANAEPLLPGWTLNVDDVFQD